MKNEEHRRKAAHYIEANPVKAGLVREAREWPWSSARFRDEYGTLPLPKGIAGAPVSKPALRERSWQIIPLVRGRRKPA